MSKCKESDPCLLVLSRGSKLLNHGFYSLVVKIPECLFSPLPLTKKTKNYKNMRMKHMRKSNPYLVIEIEGKAHWKKELIQNLAQINYHRILPIDSNGLWIQYSLAVPSTTSGENSITNVFWFIILSFSVYHSAPLHCSLTGTSNQFYTCTRQSVLSHLEDFIPKLSILNSGEGGSRSHQEACSIPK